jgi:hypothetical protein
VERRAVCALAIGLIFLSLSGGVGTAPATPTHHVSITIKPRTVVPYGWAEIEVKGVPEAAAVEVQLEGASGVRGTLFPWIALQRHSNGNWLARLPQPVLPGIYPIKLRTRPNLAITIAEVAYLRVYWDGTDTRPIFPTPEQVAAWWVSHVAGGMLVAIRRWPRQPIDHRLVSLHRLFVIAYSPPGRTAPQERLGGWITAVREGYRGKWRLLEASVTPP